MIRTQVQLKEEQMEILREWAAERRVSIAELIRQGVDLLIRSSGTMSEAEKRRRALEAVGRFHSDRTDVSVKHEEYLVEAY